MGVVLTVAIACLGLATSGFLARSARRVDAATRIRALSGGARARLPVSLSAPLARRLEAADVAVSPETAVQPWLLAVLAAGIFGLSLAPVAAAVAMLMALGAGPAWMHATRNRRDRRAADAVPVMLEAAATEMRGGATVEGAIEAVVAGGGPLAPDLQRVLGRVGIGARLGDALGSWAVERAVSGVRAAARSHALAAEVGGPSAGALDGLASSLRERQGALADARALSAQARLSALVVGAGPVGYLVLSALADPGASARLFSTRVGQVCLVAGLLLEARGAVWLRHRMGGEP